MRRVFPLLAVIVLLASCGVTTSRRLLLVAGGGTFTARPITTVAASPHGGWTQGQGPHAVEHAGYLYWATVNGTTGQLEIAGWHIATGTAVSPIVVHAAITSDTHDAPALLVRASDGKLMTWYSGHNGPTMYQRVSTNSLDSDPTLSGGFAAETSLDATFGGTAYTYPFAGQLADGSLWLGFRDNGALYYLAFARSTDDGATWTAETKVWARTLPQNSYWFVHYGATRIDMAVASDNGVTGTHVSLYHAYLEGGGNPHLTDGTSMTGTEPLDQANATLVHDGSAYPNGWASGMAIDGTGAPVILYETIDTANGNGYTVRYARWNGSAWVSTTIATFSDAGLILVAHSALDEVDPTYAVVAKPVSGVFEMFEYRTFDNGATFIETQLTFNSTYDNTYPANIADHGSTFRWVWLGAGPYVFTDNFHTGIQAR